ncbi:MAG: hypothetical protein L6R41_007345 [Letrouitia leprolyta]|nr:MAG: hypothetical protein L6R41_007345 [Letrouitia leprolyta]
MRSLLAVVLAPLAAAVALAPGKQSSSESPNLAERQTAASTSPNPAQPSFTFSQLWDANKKFLDNFIYPADVQQAKAINSTLLAEDVQGRIDITRTFNGRELNTEYLFGLFANLAGAAPGAVSLLGVPLSYEILHFAASQNIVSSLTRCVFPIPSQLKFGTPHSPISNQITNEETPKNRFQFNFTALNLIVPVEIDAWNTFNAQGQISQYDATFKHWQWTVDYLLQAAAKKFNTPTKEATVGVLSQAIAKSICQTSMQYCNGTQNVQYKSSEECFGFLTGKVRFGEAYELGKNTLLCRMVHQNMVPFRPEVHCPHIGPTGGGYCVDDKDYQMTVMENYFTNSPYIPFGYKAVASPPPGASAAAAVAPASA